jgi:hypothetical protein
MKEWTSVDDKLPENNEYVICTDLRDVIMMNSNETQVLDLQEKHGRLTQAFICYKLKVTPDEAHKLLDYANRRKAREMFIWRGFGISLEEFEKGEFLGCQEVDNN